MRSPARPSSWPQWAAQARCRAADREAEAKAAEFTAALVSAQRKTGSKDIVDGGSPKSEMWVFAAAGLVIVVSIALLAWALLKAFG